MGTTASPTSVGVVPVQTHADLQEDIAKGTSVCQEVVKMNANLGPTVPPASVKKRRASKKEQMATFVQSTVGR